MINQKLLVSGAEFFTNDYKINPYYDAAPINNLVAISEHNLILNEFREADIELIKVAPPENCQDGIYTANWGITYQGKAVLSHLPTARQLEEPYASQVLQNLGYEIFIVPNNMLFSGQGDCLRCGEYLFAGSGYRSTPEAQQFVADTLGLKLVQLHTIPQLDEQGQPQINPYSGLPDSFFYDLDLALTVISNQLIAYCPEAFDEKSQKAIEAVPIEKIKVSLKEAQKGFACNLVSTGKHVIMSDQAPNLQTELEARGLICHTPHINEIKKGGGYIRCISLALD